MKSALQFILVSIGLFSIHLWLVIPFFEIKNTIPVHYQHLLLGGFSMLIFFVAQFGAKHYLNYVGFGILGFLTLKMIFVAIFINYFEAEIAAQPILKYIFLAVYFFYLIFLIGKIVPLMNNASVGMKQ